MDTTIRHKLSTDKVATHWWLTKGSLGAEMETRIIAAQDGVTKTRAYEVTKMK